MNHVPAVSILLPTYNAAQFLAEQVGSIFAQSFEDFELVVTDDGSVDDTGTLLASYAASDPRMRVLPSSGNRGQKNRLRELVSATNISVISIADQDDIWHPDKLKLLITKLGDSSMAFGSSWIVDGSGTQAGMTIMDMIPPAPKAGDRLTYLFKPMVSAHAMIARREIISDMSLTRAHPFDWLQAVDAIFSGGVIYAPEAITYHRIHGGNQSNASLGRRPSLVQRLARNQVRRKLNQRSMERLTFYQRLEHLSFSPVITPTLRSVFARAFKACASAWFDHDRPLGLQDDNLRAALCSILKPLAGSESDWAFSKLQIDRISRATVHPVNLLSGVATALGRPLKL